MDRSSRSICALVLLALIPALVPAQAISTLDKPVGVLGLSSKTMDQAQLDVFAQAIGDELAAAGFTVVAGADVEQAAETNGCEASELRMRESCIRVLGRQVSAAFFVGGTVNVIGALHELRVSLYSTATGRPVWNTTYRVETGLEDFYTQTPPKLASDLPREISMPAPAPLPTVRPTPVEPPAELPSPAAVEPTTGEEARHTGLAPGLVIGVSGMFALGEPTDRQSPYGGKLHVLYPTGSHSHARLKAGVPLYHDSWLHLDSRGKYPDIYLSLEHDWLWSNFSIGTGLSYMYLQRFALSGETATAYYPYTIQLYRSVYEAHHGFNLVLNLRGGRPNAAFYGRLVWPLPFTIDNEEPDNIFLEYSALAAFGGKRVKAGIGFMGMYKRREADYVRQGDSTYNYTNDHWDPYGYTGSMTYEDFRLTSTSEYMILLPVLRIAGLIAGHVVVSVNLELGGTILPRPPIDDDELWTPHLGFDIVYSFGRLESADLMDGTF